MKRFAVLCLVLLALAVVVRPAHAGAPYPSNAPVAKTYTFASTPPAVIYSALPPAAVARTPPAAAIVSDAVPPADLNYYHTEARTFIYPPRVPFVYSNFGIYVDPYTVTNYGLVNKVRNYAVQPFVRTYPQYFYNVYMPFRMFP
jgi:hypothetical protein